MNFRLISLGVGLASVVGLACANGTDNTVFRNTGGTSSTGGGSNGFGTGTGGGPAISGNGGMTIGGGIPVGTDNPKADICVASKNCTDFPANPIFDGVAAGDVGGFGNPGNLAPPAFCLMEPQLSAGNTPGAMFPANWLRPRFRWDGAPQGAIFEIRLHSETETNDLVAYTNQSTWLVPFEIWKKMGTNVRSVQATVRSLAGGQVTGTQGNFEIAPVIAGGNMVYWGTISSLVSPVSSFLVSFAVGDEVVVKALTLEQVNGATGAASFGQILNENGKDLRGQYDPTTLMKGFTPGQVQCIGCHIQLPDKTGVLFTDDWPWNKVVAVTDPDPAKGGIGAAPTYVTAGARAILKQPGLGTSTAANKDLAPDLWSDAHKVIVTSYYQDVAGSVPQRLPFGPAIDTNQGKPPAERLIWIDLATTAPIPPQYGGVNGGMDATLQTARNSGIIASRSTGAWDYITVTGETMPANILPNFSQDGSLVVYTAATASQNGGLLKTAWVEADLHYVPFNAGHGGDAKPVLGAAEQGIMEYYPAWSPDHNLIAFTRVEDKTAAGYYNLFGEINVVDGAGHRTRLVANDPPACGGEHSPGVINSWPKWAPNVKTDDGRDYYFVIFSSARKYPNPIDLGTNINNPGISQKPSQLYIATVVRDASGEITTYPAIYLWNQAYTQQGAGATATAIPFQSNNLTPAWDEFVTRTVDVPPGTIPR